MAGNRNQTAEVDAVRMDALDEMRGLQNGQFSYNASSELQKVLKAVRETSKEGVLKIAIKVVPRPKLGLGAVELIGEVDGKAPRPDPESVVRFINDKDELVKDDPRQQHFTFTEPPGRHPADL